ncbi:MAG: hypothetical protein QHI38_14000, partial [Armatimonadota bacterium]|nr:hypothetical protein [Armatimonadota bacterium]
MRYTNLRNLIAVGVSIIILTVIALMEWFGRFPRSSTQTVPTISPAASPSMIASTARTGVPGLSATPTVIASASLTATSSVTVQTASPRAENDFQALLLYDSTQIRDSDINFRKLAEYYGVRLKQVDLSQTPLTDAVLKNQKGQYYLAIGINANTLEHRSPTFFEAEQIRLLKNA